MLRVRVRKVDQMIIPAFRTVWIIVFQGQTVLSTSYFHAEMVLFLSFAKVMFCLHVSSWCQWLHHFSQNTFKYMCVIFVPLTAIGHNQVPRCRQRTTVMENLSWKWLYQAHPSHVLCKVYMEEIYYSSCSQTPFSPKAIKQVCVRQTSQTVGRGAGVPLIQHNVSCYL